MQKCRNIHFHKHLVHKIIFAFNVRHCIIPHRFFNPRLSKQKKVCKKRLTDRYFGASAGVRTRNRSRRRKRGYVKWLVFLQKSLILCPLRRYFLYNLCNFYTIHLHSPSSGVSRVDIFGCMKLIRSIIFSL